MDVEDEVGGAAVGVLDGGEGGGGSAGDEGGGAGVAVSGEEDHLGGCSRAADGGDGCLDGGGPGVDVGHWKDWLLFYFKFWKIWGGSAFFFKVLQRSVIRTVVGLVHQSHDDFVITCVFRSQLLPQS